jgi:CBS domain containing-hemolysin-like protein
VDGLTRLGELEELTKIRFEESDHEEVETVGGLFMTRLGRMAVEGDEIAVNGRTLRVERLDGLRVALVRLLPDGGGPAEGSAPAGSGGHH